MLVACMIVALVSVIGIIGAVVSTLSYDCLGDRAAATVGICRAIATDCEEEPGPLS